MDHLFQWAIFFIAMLNNQRVTTVVIFSTDNLDIASNPSEWPLLPSRFKFHTNIHYPLLQCGAPQLEVGL